MHLIFYGYEDQFEAKQVQYQKGETIKQVMEKFLAGQQISEQVGFQIDMNNIIIVLKKDNTRLISLDEQVQHIIKQTKESPLELLLICPKEEGGVLIEYIVNKKYCYFENYGNKNDQLSTFIESLLKRINFQQKYEIKVNGKKNSSKAPFQKKTIKQLIGASNLQKIIVEINALEQNKQHELNAKNEGNEGQPEKKQKPKRPIRDKSNLKNQKQQSVSNKKQEQIKLNGKRNQKVQIPQRKSQPDKFVNQNFDISIKNVGKQQKKMQLPVFSNAESLNKLIQQNEQQNVEIQANDKYVFSIKFETNTGIKSQTYQAQKSKTMKDILPDVLKKLADAGFDWDPNWNHPSDYQDKLAILYGRQQYKKYEAKLMSVLSNTSNKATHDFHFQRIFQGG